MPGLIVSKRAFYSEQVSEVCHSENLATFFRILPGGRETSLVYRGLERCWPVPLLRAKHWLTIANQNGPKINHRVSDVYQADMPYPVRRNGLHPRTSRRGRWKNRKG